MSCSSSWVRPTQERTSVARSRWRWCPVTPPGLAIERHLPILGYQDQHGHSEIVFRDVRVPAGNLLAGEGDGFMARAGALGPGRDPSRDAAIGIAERALALMVDRARLRTAFRQHLADQGVVPEMIANSRMEIDQARLYVQKTAWLIDRRGAKERAPRSQASRWRSRPWPPG